MRKRCSDEDILHLLREIELNLATGQDAATACRAVGVSGATYYNRRKRFGGMGTGLHRSSKLLIRSAGQSIHWIVCFPGFNPELLQLLELIRLPCRHTACASGNRFAL